MLGGILTLFIVPHMVTASIITLHHNPGNDIFWQSTQDHPDEPPYWSVRLFVTVDLNMCTEDERRVFFQIPTTAWLICSHAYLVHRDQLATHELFPQHSTFEDKRAFRPRVRPGGGAPPRELHRPALRGGPLRLARPALRSFHKFHHQAALVQRQYRNASPQ